MLFVKTNKLKKGMRLARPIYNKDGVLLYERNSKLTDQGIHSIKAFGLLGLYILEPAEPVPPMTQEDILFERFQTMTVFALREELNRIKKDQKKSPKLQVIVNNIQRRYGHLDKKINFIQNLRSREDYVYKHALNVAILSAMMTHVLGMSVEEQAEVVKAALLHEVGKLSAPKEILEKDSWGEAELEMISTYELTGHELIGKILNEPNVRRICVQAHKSMETLHMGGDVDTKRMLQGAKVLMVAETYDNLTAMRLDHIPESEVSAIRYFLQHQETFGADIIDALIKSINILIPGVSVELSTGDKAIVIKNNEVDVLRPMVLCFRNNNIIDLSEKAYADIQITDIMKTMDNRYIFDTKTLRENGIFVQEPEDAEMQKGIEEDEEESI